MTQLYTSQGIIALQPDSRTDRPRRSTIALLRQLARMCTPKGLILN